MKMGFGFGVVDRVVLLWFCGCFGYGPLMGRAGVWAQRFGLKHLQGKFGGETQKWVKSNGAK